MSPTRDSSVDGKCKLAKGSALPRWRVPNVFSTLTVLKYRRRDASGTFAGRSDGTAGSLGPGPACRAMGHGPRVGRIADRGEAGERNRDTVAGRRRIKLDDGVAALRPGVLSGMAARASLHRRGRGGMTMGRFMKRISRRPPVGRRRERDHGHPVPPDERPGRGLSAMARRCLNFRTRAAASL